MKVSELINQLKEFPPDAEVVINWDNNEMQPAEFKYYDVYYPSYYDECHQINEFRNVVVHSC